MVLLCVFVLLFFINRGEKVETIYDAARAGDLQMVQGFLWDLTPRGDIREKDEHGRTPLHYAAEENHVNLFCILTPDNIDHVDDEGNTPLHLAAMNGHFDAVMGLHAAGALTNILKKEGNLAFDLARKNGHEYICGYLKM